MRAQIERRWREEKYAVLFYSQRHYNDIRTYLKNPQATMTTLNEKINEAKQQTVTIGGIQNACSHMWGYFKKYATTQEKQTYQQLLATLTLDGYEMRVFLRALANKYDVRYLQQSTILQLN